MPQEARFATYIFRERVQEGQAPLLHSAVLGQVEDGVVCEQRQCEAQHHDLNEPFKQNPVNKCDRRIEQQATDLSLKLKYSHLAFVCAPNDLPIELSSNRTRQENR